MSGAQHPLRIQDLVVRYGRGEPVISGVSIELAPKEIVGLIGASGAGKRTLLRAVQRLVEPESGQISSMESNSPACHPGSFVGPVDGSV